VERKLATVIFVDLVESTALVSSTDPEVVRRRVGAFFEHVSRCIAAHGGTVEKFAGDAVMAASTSSSTPAWASRPARSSPTTATRRSRRAKP
jgi:class 3 adenylate cyclase